MQMGCIRHGYAIFAGMLGMKVKLFYFILFDFWLQGGFSWPNNSAVFGLVQPKPCSNTGVAA